VAAGVRAENICLDPGLGFAQTAAQNVTLLRAAKRLAAAGHPLLIALSRKRFIGELGGAAEATQRDPGSLAAGLYAVQQGAHIVRVHDVAGTVQALHVWQGLNARDNG
jgi:dihydropteroate synthase